MDCRTARLLLDFARPHAAELEAAEAATLENHLADCPECRSLARAERRLDQHFGSAMSDVPVPEGLRQRLIARLHAQRDAWYRRRILQVAGVAAALVLVGWLGWSLQHRSASVVQVGAVVDAANQMASIERVDQWLRQEGYDSGAPSRFDYALLVSCGMAEFQGRKVPELVFLQGTAHARVYLLRTTDFDIKASLAVQRHAQSGAFTAELIEDAAASRVAYLVVYTGDSLTPFLISQPGT